MALNIGQVHAPILSQQQNNPIMSGLTNAIAAHLQMQNSQRNRAQLPYVGPQAAANLQKSQLSNQMTQAQLPYAGPQAAANLQRTLLANQWFAPEQQAAIGLKNAQAAQSRFMVANPAYIAGGMPAQVAALKSMGLVNQNGSSPGAQGMASSIAGSSGAVSGPFRTGNPAIDTMLNAPYAKAAYDQKMTQGFNFVHAPENVKNQEIAQLGGFGVEPSEATTYLSQGGTVQDYAENNGFGSDASQWPNPVYVATGSDVNKLHQRQMALNESNVINSFVTKGLGPYVRTIGNMSPSQVADAALNQDPEKQANFVAAYMMAPDAQALRIKMLNGEVGVTAMHDMLNRSLSNAKPIQALVSPQVYTQAQQIVEDKLKQAFNAGQQIYRTNGVADKSSSPINSGNNSSAPYSNSSGTPVGISDPLAILFGKNESKGGFLSRIFG